MKIYDKRSGRTFQTPGRPAHVNLSKTTYISSGAGAHIKLNKDQRIVFGESRNALYLGITSSANRVVDGWSVHLQGKGGNISTPFVVRKRFAAGRYVLGDKVTLAIHPGIIWYKMNKLPQNVRK